MAIAYSVPGTVFDFEVASAMLLREGIEARHLRDKTAVATICRQHVLRSA